MPGAVIAFDQARPGPSTSSGSPGVARQDLWQSRVVTARSTASGNVSYAWSFLDVPPGSAATITGNTTANATFTPDLPGSYRVQLVTNGGGPGNVQVLIAAIRFDINGALVNRGWRYPAFGELASEDNFNGQLRGWAESFEFILTDCRNALATLFVPGVNKNLIFNDSGVLGTDATLNFDKALGILGTPKIGLGSTAYIGFAGGITSVLTAETVNAGTVDGRISTLESEVKTTDNAAHVLSTFAISNNSMAILDFEIVAVKAGAALGKFWKKSVSYLNTAGSITTGTVRDVDEDVVGGADPTWAITFDVVGTTARILVNSTNDTVTWYIARQGMDIIPAA